MTQPPPNKSCGISVLPFTGSRQGGRARAQSSSHRAVLQSTSEHPANAAQPLFMPLHTMHASEKYQQKEICEIMQWSRAEYLTFWERQGPVSGAEAHAEQNPSGQAEAAHVTSYRPPPPAWTEARLCSADQRLLPESGKLKSFLSSQQHGCSLLRPLHPPLVQGSSGRKLAAWKHNEKWDQHSSESKTAPNSTWCPHAFLEEGSPLQLDSFLATKGVSLFSLTTIIFLH